MPISRSNLPAAALNASWRISAPAVLSILIAGCGDDITATPHVGAVQLAAEAETVAVGDTVRLQATVLDLDGNAITGQLVSWGSADTAIATVDDEGRVTGRRVGAVVVAAEVDGVVGRLMIRVIHPPSAASIEAVVTVHATGIEGVVTVHPNAERGWVIRARGTAPGAVRLEHYSTSAPNFTTDRTEIPLKGDPESPTFDIEVPATYNDFHLVAYDEQGVPAGYTLSYIGTYLPRLLVATQVEDRFVPPSANEVTIEWTAKGPGMNLPSQPLMLPGDQRIVGMKVWAEGHPATDLEFEPAQEVNFKWTPPLTDTVTTFWLEVESEAGHTNRQRLDVARTQPAEVPGSYAEVAARYCAINHVSTAYCWGSAIAGSPLMPEAVAPHVQFSEVVHAGSGTCALDSGGRAYCWSSEQYSGLTPDPQPFGGALRFEMLVGSQGRLCGLTLEGTAYCWTVSDFVKIPGAADLPPATPVQVGGSLRFRDIDIASHVCAISLDGETYCWGRNHRGQIGNGTESYESVSAPTRVISDEKFVEIALDEGDSCAVTADGRVHCWGHVGACFAGHTSPCGDQRLPAPLATDLRFAKLNGTCGLTDDGRLYCWEMLNREPDPKHPDFRFSDVEGECGLLQNGAAYCWGEEPLGNGTLYATKVPVRVIDRF